MTPPVCSCGHEADQHLIVWTIHGDATTACNIHGCLCRDYEEAAELAAAVHELKVALLAVVEPTLERFLHWLQRYVLRVR